eukprot:15274359-Alexandrium_andersonii.AAC.1
MHLHESLGRPNYLPPAGNHKHFVQGSAGSQERPPTHLAGEATTVRASSQTPKRTSQRLQLPQRWRRRARSRAQKGPSELLRGSAREFIKRAVWQYTAEVRRLVDARSLNSS